MVPLSLYHLSREGIYIYRERERARDQTYILSMLQVVLLKHNGPYNYIFLYWNTWKISTTKTTTMSGVRYKRKMGQCKTTKTTISHTQNNNTTVVLLLHRSNCNPCVLQFLNIFRNCSAQGLQFLKMFRNCNPCVLQFLKKFSPTWGGVGSRVSALVRNG